jgi:hypothetical protein
MASGSPLLKKRSPFKRFGGGDEHIRGRNLFYNSGAEAIDREPIDIINAIAFDVLSGSWIG